MCGPCKSLRELLVGARQEQETRRLFFFGPFSVFRLPIRSRISPAPDLSCFEIELRYPRRLSRLGAWPRARVRVRLGGSLQPVKLSCRGAAERVRLEGIRLSRGRRALDDHSGRDTRCGVGAVERQMHHVNRGWVGKRSRAAGTFAVNATRPVPRVC